MMDLMIGSAEIFQQIAATPSLTHTRPSSTGRRLLLAARLLVLVQSFVDHQDVRPTAALPPTHQSSQSHQLYFNSSAFLSKDFMFVPQPKLVLASVVGFMILYAKMYRSKKKIQKDHDVEPIEFEETVAQALFDLRNTNQELKSDLKDLYINQAMYDSMA
ncbi:hypothetical protein QYF36_015983 [Acer negundo]|nr:hypothetical protein QYF36_015983 [Acer negundo]